MRTGKRLFQYALLYKKRFIIALIMLSLSVIAELAGPMIAKTMINQHILGIEKPWYEVASGDAGVIYQGHVYQRSDHLQSGEKRGKEVRVLQADRKFVFIAQPLKFDGVRTFENGHLIVVQGNQKAIYAAQTLSVSSLAAFYHPEIKGMLELVALYFLLVVISAMFKYGQVYFMQTSAYRVIQQMRIDVYKQIHRLPIPYFDQLPAGKVVSRVTNDTEAIKNLYVSVLSNYFNGGIYLIGIFTAMYLLNVKMATICLIIVPILAVWIKVYRKFATQYNHIIRARLSDINGLINESIQGMPIIRAFRRQEDTKTEFEHLNEQHFHYMNKMQTLNALTSHNLVGAMRNVFLVALIWYFGGASFGIDGVVSLGVVYAFIDYLGRMFQPVIGMVNQLAQLEQALVSAERVFQLMDEPGLDPVDGRLPRCLGHVVFDQVSFAYQKDYVLKQISFEAKPGEMVALVGHTGSGKSSVMNLLFRFYDAQVGEIRIDGQNILEIPKQWQRRYMGIVLQDPFLFTGTIADNVSLRDDLISRERVEKALRDVGADQILSNLPRGFDEPVIEKGATLSLGQRQLISFARALAFDPAILILDEATANIDTETETVIQAALDVLKRGRTTFVIAHRLSTIRSADKILVLHHGEIVERGTHESLMLQRGRYYQMYQVQQGGAEAV